MYTAFMFPFQCHHFSFLCCHCLVGQFLLMVILVECCMGLSLGEKGVTEPHNLWPLDGPDAVTKCDRLWRTHVLVTSYSVHVIYPVIVDRRASSGVGTLSDSSVNIWWLWTLELCHWSSSVIHFSSGDWNVCLRTVQSKEACSWHAQVIPPGRGGQPLSPCLSSLIWSGRRPFLFVVLGCYPWEGEGAKYARGDMQRSGSIKSFDSVCCLSVVLGAVLEHISWQLKVPKIALTSGFWQLTFQHIFQTTTYTIFMRL